MIEDVIKETDQKMKKAVRATQEELTTVRTGRATPSLLDRIAINYYDNPTPLKSLASISVPEARLLVIQPWDKNLIPTIEKALMQSDLGMMPSNDGNVIRLPVPQLTEERRKEFIKVVKSMVENGRISVRNIRREANDDLKEMEKEHLISEDDLKRSHEKVQKMTDLHIEELDELLKHKETELMEV